MRAPDLLRYALGALLRQRLRSAMMLLSVALGVAAVVLLVALGEGARHYVLGEFAFMGSDTLVMFPGRKSTSGGMPPISGSATRDITLQEVGLLERNVHGIAAIAPLVVGSAPVSSGGLERESVVIGTTATFFPLRRLVIAQGSALPELDTGVGAQVAVIGETLRRALFGNRRAIGQWIRVRDTRLRVVGVLQGRGDSFGMDLSEAVFVPVATAQAMFDVNGLFRVVFRLDPGADPETAKAAILDRMRDYHDGEQDVTLVSPDAILRTFDGVLRVLTLGVSGIAGISLLVAGVLVMNLMLLSVRQRTAEIGLLKAIGADDGVIRRIFLAEAALLGGSGALAGIATGLAAAALLGRIWPVLPFVTPAWSLLAAGGAAIGTALVFAWLPASRAAGLEPVLALGRR